MPKIVNKNRNASNRVNGIQFERRNGFMVSVDEVTGAAFDLLTRVPGFFEFNESLAPSVPQAESLPKRIRLHLNTPAGLRAEAVVAREEGLLVYADALDRAASSMDTEKTEQIAALISTLPQEEAPKESESSSQNEEKDPDTQDQPPEKEVVPGKKPHKVVKK